MRKTLITGLMAAALMGMGFGFASPAQAAGSLTDNGNGTFTVVLQGGSQEAGVICAASVSESDCLNSNFSSNPPSLYDIYFAGTYSAGSTVYLAGFAQTSLPAGT